MAEFGLYSDPELAKLWLNTDPDLSTHILLRYEVQKLMDSHISGVLSFVTLHLTEMRG